MDDGILQSFLLSMNNFDSEMPNTFVFACTNRPDLIEHSAFRRFGIPVYVGPPNLTERANFIMDLLDPCVLSKKEIYELAKNADRCSFVEVEQMIAQIILKHWTQDLNSQYFQEVEKGIFEARAKKDSNDVLEITSDELPDDSLRGHPLTYKDLQGRFLKPIRFLEEDDVKVIEDFRKKIDDSMIDVNEIVE